MNYLVKISQKYGNKVVKCLFCNKIDFSMVAECKICGDKYHLNCFAAMLHSERGMFFHGTETLQTKTSLSEENETKNKKMKKKRNLAVHWSCMRCSSQLATLNRLKFLLVPPFQVQAFLLLNKKTLYLICQKNKLFGDLSRYSIPKNLEEALNDRNLTFQDDCVFLSSAKVCHNSVRHSVEPIDVIFKLNILFFLNRDWMMKAYCCF